MSTHTGEGPDAPPLDRAAIQRRTLRVLMIGVVPSGAAMAGGMSAAAVLGEELTGSDTLGGLAAAMLTLGSTAAAVPLARLMARHGRRIGLRAGWLVAAAGAAATFVAAVADLYPLVLLGILAIGAGNAANLVSRYAAADLADDEDRARAIGTLVWASTFGSVLGPTLALGWAGRGAEALGLPELAGPYLMATVLFALAALVVDRHLRPDPLVVAGGTGDGATGRAGDRAVGPALGLIAADPRARLAVTTMVVGHLVMVGIMTMTPLHMTDGDHALQVIGFVISVHILGMYALAPVVGLLVDRLGPQPVMMAAGGILFTGGELASHTDAADTTGVLVGLFLVGLGWSFGLVAGSTLLTAAVPVERRATTQGAADLAMTAAGAVAGLSAGAIAQTFGYHQLSHWLGLVGLIPTAAAGWAMAGDAGIRRSRRASTRS